VKNKNIDFPEPPTPAPTLVERLRDRAESPPTSPASTSPALVDRLAARAAAEDAKSAPTLAESVGKARAALIVEIASGGPERIKPATQALAALDKIAPEEPEKDGAKALDMSTAPLEVLEWLADAEEISRLPPEQREAYRVKQEAERKAEESRAMAERQTLRELAHVGRVYLMGQAEERRSEISKIGARLGFGGQK
jgi:hypothetical protein